MCPQFPASKPFPCGIFLADRSLFAKWLTLSHIYIIWICFQHIFRISKWHQYWYGVGLENVGIVPWVQAKVISRSFQSQIIRKFTQIIIFCTVYGIVLKIWTLDIGIIIYYLISAEHPPHTCWGRLLTYRGKGGGINLLLSVQCHLR